MIPALLLAGLVLLTRLPLRTVYVFNWDAANFALALQHFDVRLHQPHPPGYPYYVGTGWVFNLFTHEPNAALVLTSATLECVAVAGLFWLARAMLGLWPAITASLALVCSVTFWSYGELALAYPALAAFSTLVALFVYQTQIEGKDRLIAAAAAYAVGTGFRPDLAAFLLPLLAFGAWRQPRARIIASAAVAFGGIALWLVPVMLLSGGPAGYLAVFLAYAGTDVVEKYAPSVLGTSGLLTNIIDTVQYVGYALYADAVLVVGAVLLLWRRPVRSEWPQYGMLAVWVLPMLLFYVLVHIGDPGYVFGVLPALLLAGAAGWRALVGSKPSETVQTLLGSGMALALLCNVMVLFLYDKPLTLGGLRRNDLSTRSRLDFIRTMKPEEILLVTYDSYKTMKLYLPDLANSVWLDIKTPSRQVFPLPAGAKWAVLTDPGVFALAQALPAQAEYLDGDTWAALLPVRPGQSLVYENGRLHLEP